MILISKMVRGLHFDAYLIIMYTPNELALWSNSSSRTTLYRHQHLSSAVDMYLKANSISFKKEHLTT